MSQATEASSKAPGVSSRAGLALSFALHAMSLAGLLWWFQSTASIDIVAAGPGEGGEGGGGSIEVGIADPSAILGFAKPRPASFIGDQDSAVNNVRVRTEQNETAPDDETLPAIRRDKSMTNEIVTKRPTTNQEERIFTGKEERGRSQSTNPLVGRSFGNPTPALIGGIGIGEGGGSGTGTGLPGGSEYGRRIQTILSRNYNPPEVDAGGIHYVVIRLRIARDGRILSVVNGLVSPAYIRQRSPIDLVNYAAQRAIIASNPLPAFPSGFLSGTQEAVAEIWFRYPK